MLGLREGVGVGVGGERERVRARQNTALKMGTQLNAPFGCEGGA